MLLYMHSHVCRIKVLSYLVLSPATAHAVVSHSLPVNGAKGTD